MAAERPRWTTLPPLDPSAAAAVLAPPWLPTAAADRLRVAPDAAAAAIPILLHGAPAGACLGVARGLHAVGARAGPLLATASVRPDVAALPAGATLYVDATRLGPAAALLLAAAIDDGAVWVVVAAAPGTTLPPALATRLEAVVADVPALTARAADVPALATAILARFAARAGVAAPALSAAAAASLGARPWPGDVAELEAVLARAWLRRRGDTVDVSDVELAPLPTVATTEAATDRATPGPHLELLLAELAHELRNPLVTIKTFAGHLPALLEDAQLRERFKTLTDDAITRMDTLLENVLEFARLAPPRREPTDLTPILDRLLGEVEPELARREVHVRRTGTAARCGVDGEHVTYALRNLFAGVVREVPAREELVLETGANGVVTVRFTAGGEAATRLRELATPDDTERLTDPTLLPLPFTLARAALERSGGGLAVVPEAGGTTALVVRLPVADDAP